MTDRALRVHFWFVARQTAARSRDGTPGVGRNVGWVSGGQEDPLLL